MTDETPTPPVDEKPQKGPQDAPGSPRGGKAKESIEETLVVYQGPSASLTVGGVVLERGEPTMLDVKELALLRTNSALVEHVVLEVETE